MKASHNFPIKNTNSTHVWSHVILTVSLCFLFIFKCSLHPQATQFTSFFAHLIHNPSKLLIPSSPACYHILCHITSFSPTGLLNSLCFYFDFTHTTHVYHIRTVIFWIKKLHTRIAKILKHVEWKASDLFSLL